MGKHWTLSKESLKKHYKFSLGNQINKGKIPSEITRLKMSTSQKLAYKEGRRIPAMKDKVPWNKGKIGQPAWNKGLKGFFSGEKSPHWIADRTKLKRCNDDSKNRRGHSYREWRTQVWQRDNFKCRISNIGCAGRIEAHHILGWTEYVELRYEVNNGITLCHAHHPRKRAEEKRLQFDFQTLVSASKSHLAI